jgi:four helix bundle suffix protein
LKKEAEAESGTGGDVYDAVIFCDSTDLTDQTDPQRWESCSRWSDSDDAAIRVTAVLCLIHQASFVMKHQAAALEQQCIGEGGYCDQPIIRVPQAYC